MRTLVNRSVLTVAALALAGALAACTPGALSPEGTSTPSTTAPAPSSSTTAEPSASASETPPTYAPLSLGCEQVFTLDDLYAFNANFVVIGPTTEAPTPLHAEAHERGGISCLYENATSGEQLVITVGQLGADEASDEIRVRAGAVVLATDAAVPTAELASGAYWVVVSSFYFDTSDDATPVLTTVLTNLGA